MITLATITAALGWLVSHAWALALIAVPAILGFLQPVLSGLVDGLKAFLGSVWEGLKSMNFQEWLVVLTVSTVAGALGYHFGWQACIDWVHAHFKLVSKIPVSHWWKFW